MQAKNDVVDITLALSSVGGDVEFLGELVAIAETAVPALLREIQKALSSGDFRAVEEGAQLIREAAHNLSAKNAYEAALALETRARDVNAEAAREAAQVLDEEISRLMPALATLRGTVLCRTPEGGSSEAC